jgi:hypothetical protein
MSDNGFVLRSFYISPSVDEQLKHEAFANGVSKNELIRKYLRAGMAASKTKNATVKKRVSAPRKRKAAVPAGA